MKKTFTKIFIKLWGLNLKKLFIFVLLLNLQLVNVYALSLEAENRLKQSFHNAWEEYCSTHSLGEYNIDELGLSWTRVKAEYYSPPSNELSLDQMYDQQIASLFFSTGLKTELFAEDSFARVAGDYLEKMYKEIRDHYVELTEKELEKHSVLKPSYIKKLLALFNSVSAI